MVNKMEKEIVSIITPAYRCKKTILDTYNSIKKQTYPFWEWIIVEDNSNDGTLEFIKEITKNDDRVVVLTTVINSGAAVARNVGIEKARGKYIAFLDSDDLWKTNKLDHQIRFMKTNGYVFSFTNYDLLYKNNKTKKYRIKNDSATYKTLLKRNDIGCLTAMYDASAIGKFYMPLDCVKREDHGAWLDIAKKGIVAYRLDEYLSIYRIGTSTVSANKLKMLKYQYRVYRVHEGFNVIKSLWFLFVCSMNKIVKKYWAVK